MVCLLFEYHLCFRPFYSSHLIFVVKSKIQEGKQFTSWQNQMCMKYLLYVLGNNKGLT